MTWIPVYTKFVSFMKNAIILVYVRVNILLLHMVSTIL